MQRVFDKIINEKDILWMIDNNYLCMPRAYQVSTKTDLNKVKIINGDFAKGELEDTVNVDERNDIIVGAYKKLASGCKSTLVFCTGIEHSRDVAKAFNDSGIYCKSIDSTLDDFERDEILAEFKNGTLPVLTNVNIMTTGVDIPRIDCIICASPTRSKIKFVQSIGRGLRLSPETNKEECLIIDIVDVARYHDLMSTSDVFDMELHNGENIKEARERKQKEYELDELKKQEEEKQRIEKEKQRQTELELIAQQIKLFNKDMQKGIGQSYYDWYRITSDIYCVSENAEYHYAIFNESENYFKVYKLCTKKDNKNTEIINEGDNLLELIDYVENRAIRWATSFTYKNAEWKQEPATPKQKQYARYCNTKWQVHKFFMSNSVKRMIDSCNQIA
jgi:superfamily II DNA or RNA helicase